MESTESVCKFSKIQLSPIKTRNINLVFWVIALDFSCANECLPVSFQGMCKQYKCKKARNFDFDFFYANS